MKVRTGFVSNSSSSSFVIATKPSSDILRLVEMGGGYDTEIHAVGQDAVSQHLEQEFTDSLEINLQAPGMLQQWQQQEIDLYQLVQVGEFEGYDLAVIEISMHQRPLRDELRRQEHNGDLVILGQEDL